MEWWKLWVPFGATIMGIIANVYVNITQNKKQQEFQKEMAKTQIDADIKAKARIEWIKSVRDLASKLICNSNDLTRIVIITTDYTKRYFEIKSEAVFESQIREPMLKFAEEKDVFLPEYSDNVRAFFKRADSKKNDLIRCASEFYYTGQEILMYFSESEEHEKIIELINDLISTTDQLEELIRNNLTEHEKNFIMIDECVVNLENNIKLFSCEMKDYLKKEWDKAKEGK
ncbi:hypothetical protein [Enterococcus sp. DIV1059_2]|uniref:hypothetical protein n=1 Tax=Enterococcus sp. DIV1059_2 TaxID=2774664 RepID=UPI003F1FF3B0